MLFLLDENISGHTQAFLSSIGHRVIRPSPGTEDQDIMTLAETERALIITRDRDFLNFLPTSHTGIIYVRIHPSIAEDITSAVKQLLKIHQGASLQGKTIILHPNGFEIFR